MELCRATVWSRPTPCIAELIGRELRRQQRNIELIASENFTPPAVLEAVGSVLTNKYAEGYPGKRYYGGCEVVDEVETLAIERAKALYGAEHANVQPHSGSTANQAVYFAALEPGDTVLAMSLAHGGHLTHGLAVNFSGRGYDFHPLRRGRGDRAHRLSTRCAAQALKHRPKLIVAGRQRLSARSSISPPSGPSPTRWARSSWSTWPTSPDWSPAGVHPSPVPHAEWVTTTTHKTLAGPRGGAVLLPRRRTPPASTRPCSPACRAGRSSTSSPARPCASCWPRPRSSRRSSGARWRTPRCWPRTLLAGGLKLVSGRHRQPPDAGRLQRHRDDGQAGRRTCSTGWASPPTRTACPTTSGRPPSPPVCGWARRP